MLDLYLDDQHFKSFVTSLYHAKDANGNYVRVDVEQHPIVFGDVRVFNREHDTPYCFRAWRMPDAR